mmetsp:Transcript_11428/g.35515  ORF Transcript_11428/g.35515 Transcript_11428/m.35515 type:complete len:219 (-) Transcript_11428:199-855(-)
MAGAAPNKKSRLAVNPSGHDPKRAFVTASEFQFGPPGSLAKLTRQIVSAIFVGFGIVGFESSTRRKTMCACSESPRGIMKWLTIVSPPSRSVSVHLPVQLPWRTIWGAATGCGLRSHSMYVSLRFTSVMLTWTKARSPAITLKPRSTPQYVRLDVVFCVTGSRKEVTQNCWCDPWTRYVCSKKCSISHIDPSVPSTSVIVKLSGVAIGPAGVTVGAPA